MSEFTLRFRPRAGVSESDVPLLLRLTKIGHRPAGGNGVLVYLQSDYHDRVLYDPYLGDCAHHLWGGQPFFSAYQTYLDGPLPSVSSAGSYFENSGRGSKVEFWRFVE